VVAIVVRYKRQSDGVRVAHPSSCGEIAIVAASIIILVVIAGFYYRLRVLKAHAPVANAHNEIAIRACFFHTRFDGILVVDTTALFGVNIVVHRV
jgi:hypothetical protein